MDASLMLELLTLLALLVGAGLAWLAVRLAAARRERDALLRAVDDEAAARHRAASRAAWLDAALDATAEGVLVADAGGRVIHWNRRFATLSGLPDDAPRAGATLAALLRLSAEAGEFGLVDVDTEVATQLALIAQGRSAFPRLRHRPDGGIVEFTLDPVPGGGIVLRCTDVTDRHRPAAALPAAPAAPPPPAALPPPPPRARRCLVLLVEDMKVNQMVTATQLRRDGHRVDVADSGPDALRMAAATPYDVVLMDLMMPGMSGYEAAARLRALPGVAGRVPIFALTANTGEEERARCLAAGMQGMMSKPVPAAQLREALAQGTATPAVPVLPADGLLDTARLAELRRDLPPAILASLCRQCLDDMRDRLAALHAALSQDTAAAEREAHALAGMAGSYGLARIERQSRAVMSRARAGDLPAARAAAAGLDDAYDQSRVALLSWSAPAG